MMTLTGISSSSFTGHFPVGVAADGAADDGVAGVVHEEWSHSSPQEGQERVICILYEWSPLP